MRPRRFLLGLLVWLVPFVVALAIGPLRATARPLFESIMPVVLTTTVLVALAIDYRDRGESFLGEGMRVGLLWLAISLALDFLMFSSGPMKMSLTDYMADIGLTYLIIPIVTIGCGHLVDAKLRAVAQR